jgi:beta-lactamase regulating signal transducer with metallopeptidase domain
MSWMWTTPSGWLVRSVVGGGLLLLLTWILMKRTRQPARRQRLGEWGIAAALLLAVLNLGPTWLPLFWLSSPTTSADLRPAVKLADSRSSVAQNPPRPPLAPTNPREQRGASLIQPQIEDRGSRIENQRAMVEIPQLEKGTIDHPSSTLDPPAFHAETARRNVDDVAAVQAPSASPAKEKSPINLPARNDLIWPIVCIVYATVACFLIGRWLLGYLALQRILAGATSPPVWMKRLFGEMVGRGRRPRLLISTRLRVPLSCGLTRPTVVVPASMAQMGDIAQLRWVFAHELTHLRRRDACSCLLFGLGQGLYFFWPWFWWLRRQVRLCQEFIADAAAVRWAGPAEDYAAFLLSMTTAPAVPVSATGVMGNSSDLFRRVTMLLHTPKRMERKCPWRWTLAAAGGLLALAVMASGIGPRASASPDQEKKAAAPADKTAPQEKDKKDEAPKAPQPPATPFPPGGGGFPDDDMQQRMRQMMRNRMMGAFGGHARLGVRISQPSEALVDQLDLPKGQGLVIEDVMPDTPAAKAGLKSHDILLELNGKAVPSNQGEFVRQVQEIKADSKVDAVVLRKGKKETIKDLTLPEEKAAGFGRFGPGGFPGGGAPPGGFQPFGGGDEFTKPIPRPGVGGAGGFGAGGFGGGFGGGNFVMTTVTRTNDRFTTRHQEGSLIITVTGAVSDGKSKTDKIHVQDGQVAHEYESLDKVPDQYRDKVKNLIEMSEKGSVKFEIKTPEAKPEAK